VPPFAVESRESSPSGVNVAVVVDPMEGMRSCATVVYFLSCASAFPGISPAQLSDAGPGSLTETTGTAGRDFLRANAKKAGVVELASGVQYTVLTSAAAGARKIQDGLTCRAHYSARLHDAESPYFTSFTHGHMLPMTTNDGHLVQGAAEVLALMSEGDRWEIYLPSEQAYGDSSPDSTIIPPGAVIVVVIEVVKAVAGKDEL